MKAHGYSLWLLPPLDMRQQLVTVIDRLSVVYGAPKFEPHITLLGSLQGVEENVIERAAALFKTLPTLQITLKNLSCSPLWKKCLFIDVAPTEELTSAYRRAQECFEQPRQRSYDPHISLIYGTYPSDVRKQMMHGLGGWFGTHFWVNFAAIVATEGAPEQWQMVKTFSL